MFLRSTNILSVVGLVTAMSRRVRQTVKGTRGQIIELLRQHSDLTVQALVDHLELAPAAVRRHLDILVGQGVVEYRSVKQTTGRPYHAYRLTDQARDEIANDYPRLMERLILEARALDEAAAPAGHILDSLFERVSDRLVVEHSPEVRGGTLEQRMDSLTAALHEEGILDSWSKQADGYHLYNNTCPHHRAARASSGLCCASERRAIALLLHADVEQVGSIAAGTPVCEYVVQVAPSPDRLQPLIEQGGPGSVANGGREDTYSPFDKLRVSGA